MLKGLPESGPDDCFRTRLSLNPGDGALASSMNSLGEVTAQMTST
jgi:hypothetical protein